MRLAGHGVRGSRLGGRGAGWGLWRLRHLLALRPWHLSRLPSALLALLRSTGSTGSSGTAGSSTLGLLALGALSSAGSTPNGSSALGSALAASGSGIAEDSTVDAVGGGVGFGVGAEFGVGCEGGRAL